MNYKLGLLPHTSRESDIALTSVYKAQTSLPGSFGVTGLPWGMLGNERFGDCYFASACHETMAQAYLAGREPHFSEANALTSYARYLGLNGLNELNERTDQGTDARAGAEYRRKTGVLDAGGAAHHIGAYTFINEPDYELVKSAVYDFGAACVCIEAPESIYKGFEEGVWDYVKGSKIVGGHAVSGVAVNSDGELVIVTWGGEVRLTEAFLEQYMQTTVVYISGSDLNGEGKTINGLDREALKKLLPSF